LVAAVALALAALVGAGLAWASGTLDQSQTGTSGFARIFGPNSSSGPNSLAQTFTAGLTGGLDRVDLVLSQVFANAPLTVVASASLSASSVPIDTDWVEIGFGSPPSVVSGTQYAIVVYTGNQTRADAEFDDFGSAGDPYSGGTMWSSSASPPTTWTQRPDIDIAFKTYVVSPTVVALASAGASRTNRGVLVRWRTGTETDLLGFQVYRSRGHSWRRVTRSLVEAKGTVSGATYRFLDNTARRGVAYRYRIKAVNRDGTASWFGPVRVK
jgi:hypothetical protein